MDTKLGEIWAIMVIEAKEIFETFGKWYAEAQESEPALPDSVAVASVNSAGEPSLRMVLLKAWSEDGFVFYTNFESRKGD